MLSVWETATVNDGSSQEKHRDELMAIEICDSYHGSQSRMTSLNLRYLPSAGHFEVRYRSPCFNSQTRNLWEVEQLSRIDETICVTKAAVV